MMQTIVLLLLTSLTVVSGFGSFVLPTPASSIGFAAGSFTTTSATTTATTTTTSLKAIKTNNIFQEYTNKPIVLLGTSSEHNELTRLAQFLAQKLGSDVIDSYDATACNTNTNTNVLVLDFKTKDYSDTAKSLYQDSNLLSIYVNVLGADSNNNNSNKEESTFVPYSDYELCIQDEGTETAAKADDWQHIEWELTRLVARALLPPSTPGGDTTTSNNNNSINNNNNNINSAHLTMGDNTFFLSLSLPTIQEVEPYVSEMCRDVDAMEYRTDLLECRDSRFDLIYGQQLLRKYCRPHAKRVPGLFLVGSKVMLDDVMPIVYTVRTRNQAGTYPDDERAIHSMFHMLEWGLRSGVEVLDVESAWDQTKTTALLSKASERYSSQILGSHHVVGQEIALEEAVELFQKCGLQGRAHGAKVVLTIESEEKDRMAYQAALISQSLAQEDGQPVIPSISLILGEIGQFSRVVNLPFTPVTHESLPNKAAPGQLTANEIMTARLFTKMVTSQQYCILGHNIEYSVSPQMHNAAFEAVRLPHAYARADVATVEEFIESDFFKGGAFAGASVTIPHKQSIMKYVDVLSDAAKTIGSVNTLVVQEEMDEEDIVRSIYGDNTDWKGIFNPLSRILSDRKEGEVALILGGGGTARAAAYAAQQLGLDRLYYNRTPEKAQDLADTFGGTVMASLDDADAFTDMGGNIRVVISTLPAAAEFVLPEWILSNDDNNDKPIIFDVNYKPYSTKLLEQAEEAGCTIVRGSEMLWEQGVGQFELWTKRTAPYKVMRDVVLENCLPVTVVTEEEAFQ